MISPAWTRLTSTAVALRSFRAISTSSSNLKGHSKWQNIKATKGKNDLIKSQNTNMLLRKVKAAVAKGGFDLKLNRELSSLEQDFRAKGLSLDTFKSFLQKLKDKPDVECQYDVIGPAGTFFIVVVETSSKKTFEGDLRKYFNKVGGFRLASNGGVRSWFEEKGIIHVEMKKNGQEIKLDKMEETVIEMECEEVAVVTDDNGPKFELVCDPLKLSSIENSLASVGFTVLSTDVIFRAMHPITLPPSETMKVDAFFELLQDDEQVRQIFDNIAPDAPDTKEK